MSQHNFLIMILLISVFMIFIWRQLLMLVAALAIVVFGLGLYRVAEIIHF